MDSQRQSKQSDMEIALFLIQHIENPPVDPETGANPRDFYLEETKKVLREITDPNARAILRHMLARYQVD